MAQFTGEVTKEFPEEGAVRDAALKKRVYQKIDVSKGHELGFYRELLAQEPFPGCKQLVRVARQMLAMQASSASPERVWSRAGNVIRAQRSRLLEANGCALVRTAVNLRAMDDWEE